MRGVVEKGNSSRAIAQRLLAPRCEGSSAFALPLGLALSDNDSHLREHVNSSDRGILGDESRQSRTKTERTARESENAKIRLLINAIPTRPGGGLMVLKGLLEAWRAGGHPLHITVVASSKQTLDVLAAGGWANEVVQVALKPGTIRQFLWEQLRLGSLVRAHRPDVVLTNNLYVHNLPCPQVVHHQDLWRFVRARDSGVRRNLPGDGVRNWLARKALRSAQANVFVSDFIRCQAESQIHGKAPGNNCVIYNGVSEEILEWASAPSKYDGGGNLMAIQSANEHKDNPTLLHTLRLLIDREPAVDWRLHVAGSFGRSTWGPYQAQAQNLGIADRITWHGYCNQQQLDALLRQSLCLVFTSVLESFGLPPLEAMARRCPTVAANATAVPEIIGDAGMLVEQRRPEQFADAILRLHRNPDLREELVEKGLARIRNFPWRASGDQFFTLFQQIAGKETRQPSSVKMGAD